MEPRPRFILPFPGLLPLVLSLWLVFGGGFAAINHFLMGGC